MMVITNEVLELGMCSMMHRYINTITTYKILFVCQQLQTQ